jgi:hypothetical protein
MRWRLRRAERLVRKRAEARAAQRQAVEMLDLLCAGMGVPPMRDGDGGGG